MPTYYIDPAYGAGGVGTDPTDPFDSWNDVFSIIVDGDTIRFKRGINYNYAGPFSLTNKDDITFEAYYNTDGTDDETQPRPIIDFGGATGNGINLTDGSSNTTVRNLHLKSASGNTGSNTRIISVGNNGVGLTVVNCKLEGQSHTDRGAYGIDVGCGMPWLIENNEVIGCMFGFQIKNTSALPGESLQADYSILSSISNNIIHKGEWATTGVNAGLGIGDGIAIVNTNGDITDANYNLHISNNTILNYSASAINCTDISKVIIENNLIGDPRPSADRGGSDSTGATAFTMGRSGGVGGHSSIFRNNLIRNIQGTSGDGTSEFSTFTLRGGYNHDVYNNLIVDCQRAVVIFQAQEIDNRFYNNVIIRDIGETNTPSGSYSVRVDLGNLDVYNNIWVDCTATDELETDNSGVIVYGNNCFNVTPTLTPGTGTLTDAGGNITADPKLTIDYKLQVDSPCIGAGTIGIANTDYFGANRVSNHWDIGAIWYGPEDSSESYD